MEKTSGPSNGTATVSGTGASLTITYSPTANWSGSDSFVVRVTDVDGYDEITVNVTVNAVNDAPVITGQSALSTNEDTALTIVLGNLTVTDVDNTYPAGFSLTVQSGSNYTFSGNTITPFVNYNGTLTVPVYVNDGSANSNTYNLTVTVNAVNDAPVITEGASVPVTMSEDDSPTPFSLTLNATDTEAGTLTWSISTAALNGTAGASGTGNSKAVTYSPNANYNGSDSFVVQVSDGSLTDTITVNVTINAVNDAPVITGQSALSTNEDTTLTIVLGNLTVTDADNTYPAGFSLTVQSGSNYTFSGNTITPFVNYNGTLTVPVYVNDGSANSASYNLSVTVTAVNDVPSFTKGADQTVNEDAGSQTVSGWATAISKGGGTDESGQTLTFNVTNNNNALFSVQPAVNATTGDLAYTPASNQNGSATVTVTLSDNGGTANGGVDTSANQTFTITVNAVNDVPSFTKGGIRQ